MNNKLNFVKIIFGAALLMLTFAAAGATISAQDKTSLLQKVSENADPLRAELVNKFVTFNLSPGCWNKIGSANSYPDGVSHVGRIGKAIQEHARLMGYGNLEDAVSGVQIDRGKSDAAVNKMNGRFSYTINAQNIACEDEQYRLLAAYSLQIISFFGDSSSSLYGLNRGWRPSAGKMLVVLNLSPTARDIAVAVSPDGATFTVTAPVNTEPSEWDVKIEKGLAKGGK